MNHWCIGNFGLKLSDGSILSESSHYWSGLLLPALRCVDVLVA